MSKRKNTLNDLEEFLKLQASTLAAPQPVETARTPEPVGVQQPVPERLPPAVTIQAPLAPVAPIDLLTEMKKMASLNKRGFYDFIIETIEAMPNRSANDLLLINTALYLKHGDNWKNGIEDYWRAKKKS